MSPRAAHLASVAIDPLVTVIVPTRRRHDLLRRALASLVIQTHPRLEILVVDDNDPGERVAETEARAGVFADPRVRLLVNEGTHSAAGARNAGLAAAQGEWTTYLDDDDEYRPAKIERQLALAQRERTPLVTCGYVVQLAGRSRVKQVSAARFSEDAILSEGNWGTPMLFHRRTELRFNEALRAGEDTLFAFALMRRYDLATIHNVPEPLVIVHQQSQRVNHEHRHHWRADRLVVATGRNQFSRAARRKYLARGLLAAAKHGNRQGGGMCDASARLLRVAGWREWRAIANAWLFRVRWFRRWLVS